MSHGSSGAVIACLSLAGFILFCRGFFPVKPSIPGYNTPGSVHDHHELLSPVQEGSSIAELKPAFDRLVFIVVDALRR